MQENTNGYTPIMWAIAEKSYKCLESLLTGADKKEVNAYATNSTFVTYALTSTRKTSAVWLAAKNLDMQALRLLLDSKKCNFNDNGCGEFDFNDDDVKNRISAKYNNYAERVKNEILGQKYYCMNHDHVDCIWAARENYGGPLCSNCKYRVEQKKIQEEADKKEELEKHLLYVKENAQDTPLHVCVRQNSEKSREVARFLIQEAKVDVNCTNYNGSSPLEYAGYGGDLEMVRFLLNNGANPNLKNKDGDTLLYSTIHLILWPLPFAQKDEIESTQKLFELLCSDEFAPKINFNTKVSNNKLKHTALHYAVWVSKLSIVRLLVATGRCDLNTTKNSRERTTVLEEAEKIAESYKKLEMENEGKYTEKAKETAEILEIVQKAIEDDKKMGSKLAKKMKI